MIAYLGSKRVYSKPLCTRNRYFLCMFCVSCTRFAHFLCISYPSRIRNCPFLCMLFMLLIINCLGELWH